MPFAKTAYFPIVSGGEINHYNMVRIRIVGFGNLKMKMNSMDEVEYEQIADIKIPKDAASSQRSLAAFLSERMSLELSTSTIDEWFDISRITIYSTFFSDEDPQ